MVELKNMTDKELARRMVKYIEQLENLMCDVSEIRNNKSPIEPYRVENIRDIYRKLKEDIKADAHYVGLERNKKRGHNLYNSFFDPSIREASAFGFTSPTNSAINHKFFSSIEEAHYKLTKYHGLDEWKKIAQ